MMPTSEAEYILYKILLSVSLLIKDLFSIDSGIHLLYARKFCRRPTSLRKSVPRSKVATRLRLNVLCWCTAEACKYSITSAIVMAVANDFLLKRNTGRLCKTGL